MVQKRQNRLFPSTTGFMQKISKLYEDESKKSKHVISDKMQTECVEKS
jgi:hypothetical protein